MGKYAVVIYNSFDGDRPVCLFDTEEEARNYMRKVWESEYNIALAEDVDLNEEDCWFEEDEAKIRWVNGDYIRIISTYVREPNVYHTGKAEHMIDDDSENENQDVLAVVDEALKKHGADIISVDVSESGRMINVDLCGGSWSDYYKLSVARVDKCNLAELEKELDKRGVGHCGW